MKVSVYLQHRLFQFLFQWQRGDNDCTLQDQQVTSPVSQSVCLSVCRSGAATHHQLPNLHPDRRTPAPRASTFTAALLPSLLKNTSRPPGSTTPAPPLFRLNERQLRARQRVAKRPIPSTCARASEREVSWWWWVSESSGNPEIQ